MATIENRTMIKLLSVYGKGKIIVPIYQRAYDWTNDNVQELLDDLLNHVSKDNNSGDYYLGNIVFKKIPNQENTYALVDGQQRITTTLFILIIIQRKLITQGIINNQLNRIKKVIKECIYNDKGEIKLQIKRTQNESLIQDIMDGESNIKGTNEFKVFQYLESRITSENLEDLYDALGSTILSIVNLDHDEDENKIFEKINASGKHLEAVDLIKNYLFSKCHEFTNHEETNILKLFEDKLNKIPKKNQINFFRYFIALNSKDKMLINRPDTKKLYKSFKELVDSKNWTISTYNGVIDILKEIEQLVNVYELIHNEDNNDTIELKFYKSIIQTKWNTYFVAFAESILSLGFELKDELIKIFGHLIIRRILANRPDKNITRDIPRLFNHLKDYLSNKEEDINLNSLKNFLFNENLRNYSAPSNDDILTIIEGCQLYSENAGNTEMLLKLFELIKNEDKEHAFSMLENSTIAQIMPQNYHVKNWKTKLGDIPHERSIRLNQLINTLGNLTLIGDKKIKESFKQLNFDEKIADPILKNSELAINKEVLGWIGNEWNEPTIEKRTKRIAKEMLSWLDQQIWNQN